MPLTEIAIRKAKPDAKPYKMGDGGGLFLLIKPNGSKWWRWKYRRPVTGAENLLSMGTYPEVGLADARARRDEARKLVAAGTDPGEQRKAEHAAKVESVANTFAAVSELDQCGDRASPGVVSQAVSIGLAGG